METIGIDGVRRLGQLAKPVEFLTDNYQEESYDRKSSDDHLRKKAYRIWQDREQAGKRILEIKVYRLTHL
jgi:hypothetical protein